MAKLTHSHDITEKRAFGRIVVNQTMEIEVDYDHKDDSYSLLSVNIYQDGKFICEISELLDKAKGHPLSMMLTSIEWPLIYKYTKNESYAA